MPGKMISSLLATKKVEGHHQKKEGEQFPPAQQISNTGQQAGRFRLLDGARRVGNEALLEGGEAVGQRAQQRMARNPHSPNKSAPAAGASTAAP